MTIESSPAVAAVWSAFAAQYPAEAAWITSGKGGAFGASLYAGVLRWGGLTPRQLEAVQRNVRQAAAVPVEVSDSALREAFAKAAASGLKRPVLRLDSIKVSPAPSTGKNPGALYVKSADSGAYLGKVAGGAFLRSRDCDDTQAQEVAALMSDPAKALDAYGRRTGSCGCCGRTLTAAESVERGIGPICAANWGL